MTNYADNQQNFEGSITFELQGIPSVWNLVTNWLINQRVTPQSLIVSPNGLVVQSYIANPADPRTGAWLNSAGITIDAEASIKLNCNVMALLRTETYSANTYRTVRVGPGIPTAPMNPSPYNRNPFPGWSAQAVIGWPGSPSAFSQSNPTGMFMMGADATFNNNCQVIRGCIGLPNPAAIMQGVMTVEGTVRLFRDGTIPDPYSIPNTPFTASGASLLMNIGLVNPIPQINLPSILLTSEEFTIQGQNTPVPRTFGFAGVGDGQRPPMLMPSLS